MMRISIKKSIAALAAAAVMTGSVCAADYMLEDFENTDQGQDVMNYSNGAWYVFDDGAPSWDKATYNPETNSYEDPDGLLEPGNSVLTAFGDKTITEEDIKKDTIRNSNGDILKIKRKYPNFVATDGAGTEGRGLKTSFKLGDVQPKYDHEGSAYEGYIGIGTGLVPDGKYAQLSSDMSIKFDIKADFPDGALVNKLDVDFAVETNQYVIAQHGNFYKVKIDVTDEWQTMEFQLVHESDTALPAEGEYETTEKFHQHNWWNLYDEPASEDYWGWEAADTASFVEAIEADPKWEESHALTWNILNDGDNTLLQNEEVTLYIDNVVITNYEPFFDDQLQQEDTWTTENGTEGDSIYHTGGDNIIGDGNGWYVYNDIEGRDTAGLVLGEDVTEIKSNGTGEVTYNGLSPKYSVADGAENVSMGFTLGKTYTQTLDGKDIQIFPFAGLAMELNADLQGSPYNAEEKGFNGIRFDYSTTGDMEWMQVRMVDTTHIEADGASFYVSVPATGGEMKTATISFDDLTLPWWDDKDKGKNFKPAAIKGVEFAYEGKPGESGTITVDNVLFVSDANQQIKDITGVVNTGSSEKAGLFDLSVNNTSLNIAMPEGVNTAKAMIYSVNGQLVKSEILSGRSARASVSTQDLTNGTYIFKVVSTSGRRASLIKAVSVVK